MKPKFNVGDRIARTGYERSASERLTIDEIVSDGRPFCSQWWYICTDERGKRCNGLVGVVDGCFHRIN